MNKSRMPDYVKRIDDLIRKSFPSTHPVSEDWGKLISDVAKFASLRDLEVIKAIESHHSTKLPPKALRSGYSEHPLFTDMNKMIEHVKGLAEFDKSTVCAALEVVTPSVGNTTTAFCIYNGAELYYKFKMPGTFSGEIQAGLYAIIAAMKIFNECELEQAMIFTSSTAMQNGFRHWVPNWKRNGWKTKAGDEVKFQALWKNAYATLHCFRYHEVSEPTCADTLGYLRIAKELAEDNSK